MSFLVARTLEPLVSIAVMLGLCFQWFLVLATRQNVAVANTLGARCYRKKGGMGSYMADEVQH